GNSKRKERVLQLMSEPARQLPPRRHPLSLHQTLTMINKLARHAVECAGERFDFNGGAHLADPRIPIATRHSLGGAREAFHGTRHQRRNDVGEDEAGKNAESAKRKTACADAPDERRQLTTRAADEQHTWHGAIRGLQGDGVDRFGTVSPYKCLTRFLAT